MDLSDDALTLLRSSVRSVWALELLLLLRRDPERSWSAEALIRELRGSAVVVEEALASLTAAGLVIDSGGGGSSGSGGVYGYRPAAPVLDQWVQEIVDAYALRPSAVIRQIFSAPGSKVQIFADSFRFRNPE